MAALALLALAPALAFAPLVPAQVTTVEPLPDGMAGVPVQSSLSDLLGHGWEIKGFAVDQGNQDFILQNGHQVVLCQVRIDPVNGQGGSACVLLSPPGLK